MIRSRRFARQQRNAARQAELSAIAEQNRVRAGMYTALTAQIRTARRAVAGDPRHPGTWIEQRAAHRLLTSLLADAVTLAFAADASGAPCPPDVEGWTGWTGEGLARSAEREIATFAALDVG